MPSTDPADASPARSDASVQPPGRLRRVAAWMGLCALSACHSPMPPSARAGAPAPAAQPPAGVPTPVAPSHAGPARTIDEYRLQAAARMIAANPKTTYTTPAPNPLLAIPVLEIEVNADGSVRHIGVLRAPTQAGETVQMAIAAVRRAAPFGDATHLPRPWRFTETFLFDDDHRFKPRILD